MPATFEEKLDRLAELMVHAGAVRKRTHVLLFFHSEALELARHVEYHAFRQGARFVEHLFEDHRMLRTQLAFAPTRHKLRFSDSYRAAWRKLMGAYRNASAIQLRTEPDPKLFGPVSREFGKWNRAARGARSRFVEDGIHRGLVPWTLTYVPNERVAHTVYPELSPRQANGTYWNDIFRMTGADKHDCLARWQHNEQKLIERRTKLNALELATLHFTSGKTDLTVGLSTYARWLGGPKRTWNGRSFVANIPTYEVFTTPDWRTVSGMVYVTKPVVLYGTVVTGLWLLFREGRVVDFGADEGIEAVRQLLKADEGSCQVGEVALVGLDSPVARSGRLFRSTLFDENAACHIALGFGYTIALQGGIAMSKKELREIGCNDSLEHEDVMISDEHTTVTGHTHDGRIVTLIEGGHWTYAFR